MSFFKKILGIMASFGFVIMLFIVCGLLIVLNENKIINYQINDDMIEIYKKEEIENIKIINLEEKLKINVKFKNDHFDKYYLAYGYYYLDKYKKDIEIFVKESLENKLINIYCDNSSYIIKTTR